MALGGIEETVEDGDVRREKVFERMDASLGVGKKRTLEVDADRMGGRFGRVCGWATSLANPVSERRVASRGAVTVVARKLAVPWAARKRPMVRSASGVASITSWPAAPWMCTSRKAGERVAPGKCDEADVVGISVPMRVRWSRSGRLRSRSPDGRGDRFRSRASPL